MSFFLTRLTLVTLALVQFAATTFAGPLDDHYLQQFGEARSGVLQKALLSVSSVAPQTHRCGMPHKNSLSRDWNLLEPTTQKVLAKQLTAPSLSGPELTLLSTSGRFLIHYTTSGGDAVPSVTWVQTVANTFDDVAEEYLRRGWNLAPTIGGKAYDIYMRNMVGIVIGGEFGTYYGVVTAPPNSSFAVPSTAFPNAYASYMEIDKDFLNRDFTNPPSGNTYTPLQSLQITAAHEYHHAIQYGYNYYFEIWYAEATSTWYEDELYDSVNQLYSYISKYLVKAATYSIDMPKDGGSEYGRWILNRYLAEQYDPLIPGVMIRSVWEKLGGLNSSNASDIRTIPVLDSVISAKEGRSFSKDFFSFAKRIYMRDWTTHLLEKNLIPSYTTVAEYSSYPVNSSTIQAPSVTLPHYSFAYYKFTPASGASPLTITISKNSGIQTAAFRKSTIGGITEITADSSGNSYTDNTFSSASEVVLLIANTSDTNNLQANFSTDASTPVVPDPVVPAASSGGGGGCFIATAAYGSYLHPQVQLLRQFRDNQLLTNAPGRAFVALYYRCSPPLADFIARHPVLRSVTRTLLTPVVMAVVHPAAAGAGALLTVIVLYRPVRRRFFERGALTVPT